MTRIHRAAVTLACMLVVAPAAAAQSPWSRVPALPTSCYTTGETFAADAERALADLQTAIDRQEAINAGIKERFAALSMSEQQSRMVAFLQRDPVAGQRYMESVAAGSSEVQARLTASSERRIALTDRWNEAKSQFEQERGELWKLKGRWNTAKNGEPGVAPDPALARRLGMQYDTEYRSFCAKWFRSPQSPYLSYLAALKTFLVEDEIPVNEQLDATARLSYQVMSIPAANFRSTAGLKAAKDYLQDARVAFDRRDEAPLQASSGS